MLCSDILNQFLNQHGFSDTGSSEQTDLSSLCIRCKKINDFDSGLKNLDNRTLFFKCRRISVDFPVFLVFQGFTSVNRIAKNVEETSKCLVADRNLDPCTGRDHFHVTAEAFTCGKHDTADCIISDML